MQQTQEQIEKLKTLQESYNYLADKYEKLASRTAHYDSATGNLTIENVQITIE